MKNKRNILGRWLGKWKAAREKARIFNEKIPKEEFEVFFQQVEEAVRNIIKDYQDQAEVVDKLGEESARWLRNMKQLNASSFKAGVCVGIYLYLKYTLKEKQKQGYVV